MALVTISILTNLLSKYCFYRQASLELAFFRRDNDHFVYLLLFFIVDNVQLRVIIHIKLTTLVMLFNNRDCNTIPNSDAAECPR